MKCGPFYSYDAGHYDPRGSGTDYDILVCRKCGKQEEFSTPFRSDFYELFEEACNRMKTSCKNPEVTLEYHKERLKDFWSDKPKCENYE